MRRRIRINGSFFMEIISVFYIEPRTKLVVVRIIDRYYVLGCSENSMQLLLNLPKEEVEDCIKREEERRSDLLILIRKKVRRLLDFFSYKHS